MIRINRLASLTMIVIASIWAASAAGAQAPSKGSKSTAKAVTADTVSIREIERAAEELAEAVEKAVRKATEDPSVKIAALKVAKNAVSVAQVAITLQAETLSAVLESLARDIALAAEKQEKAKRP